MTAPARFRQGDVQKAIKAAIKAGEASPRVILRPNGEIEIICGSPKPANDQKDIELL